MPRHKNNNIFKQAAKLSVQRCNVIFTLRLALNVILTFQQMFNFVDLLIGTSAMVCTRAPRFTFSAYLILKLLEVLI